MAIIRTSTGLKEVQDKTLRERLDQLNGGQVTTALGAQQVGATPKQQDMAGTQVRKDAVIQQNLAPKEAQTSVADRYLNKQAALTEAQQGQLTEAEKLAKLAGLDTRVQKLAEDRANQVSTLAPVQRQANETVLGTTLARLPGISPETHGVAAQALKDYANDPTKREQALVTLKNLGIQPADINNLLETTDAALGRLADPTALLSDDLNADITQMGYAGGIDELGNQMGMNLRGMPIEKMLEEVGKYRNKITGERQKLEAQAMGQTGMQQQAAMGQLQSFTAAGGAAQEQAAKQALQPIDMAAQIKVGDQDMNVSEFLKDEDFSNLIEEWALATPEQREKLIPAAQFGPLTQWLTTNEASLKAAAAGQGQANAAFEQTQQAAQGLGKGVVTNTQLLGTMVPGYDPNKAYTAAEVADMQTKMQNSGMYKAAATNDVSRAYVNSLKPEDAAKLATLSQAKVQEQADNNALMKSNIMMQKKFPDLVNKAVLTDNDILGMTRFNDLGKDTQALLNQKGFDGLTTDELKYFQREDKSLNGEMVKEYQEFKAEQAAYDSDSAERNVANVFGGTAGAANSKYQELKARAEYGDPDAVAGLAEFAKMDVTGGPDGKPDGVIDAKDAAAISKERKTSLAGKSALDFKTGYDTAKEYQTVGEKYGKLGTSVASNTGKGAYGSLTEFMKSGDVNQLGSYTDAGSVQRTAELIASADKAGVGGTAKVAALKSAYSKMKNDYMSPYNAPIPSIESAAERQAKLKTLETDPHPFAKDAAAKLKTELKKYGQARADAIPHIDTASKTVRKDSLTGPSKDIALLFDYWGTRGGYGGLQEISTKEANNFRSYLRTQYMNNPSFRLDVNNPEHRASLEKYMLKYTKNIGYDPKVNLGAM
jgi:hypothetical protein